MLEAICGTQHKLNKTWMEYHSVLKKMPRDNYLKQEIVQNIYIFFGNCGLLYDILERNRENNVVHNIVNKLNRLQDKQVWWIVRRPDRGCLEVHISIGYVLILQELWLFPTHISLLKLFREVNS